MTLPRSPHALPAVLALILLWWAGTAALSGVARANDSILCREAVRAAEASLHLPDAFLSAIARVESGRPDRSSGTLAAWPWTINAEGAGSFFDTKAQAIAAVQQLQARGVHSIDVGCLQVNLMHHPEAFASLDQAFDPGANATFAGRLLQSLFGQTGSWPLAAAAYHSQTPTIGAAYQKRVLAEWAVPDRLAPALIAEDEPRSRSPMAVAHGPRPMEAAALPPSGAAGASIGRVSGFAVRSAPAAAGLAPVGRSLADYRLVPTALALRAPPRSG
jgi:hypothetical protein